MKKNQYTSFVGQKFHENGSVCRFPGNTIISKITPDMPIHGGLVEAQERLKSVDFASKYAFLPSYSFHMTVMEGLCDQVRTVEQWSKRLALQTPLSEVHQFMSVCFSKILPPQSLTMRITDQTFPCLLVIVLEPADEKTATSLKIFRERFSQEAGIRFPNHDNYTYHVSLAYNIIVLTPYEEQVIEEEQQQITQELSVAYPTITLGSPRLVYFEDMLRFDDAF